MKLPKDLLSGNYTKPRLFLCESDKTIITQLDTSNTRGTFKFNTYSELSFDVSRLYNDIFDGTIKVNPFYDKIEALRLIYLEGFGYFELQGPQIIGDGIQEKKSCTAYSLEYTLAQKYLDHFYINTGEVDSVEVIYSNGGHIIPVTLYNPSRPQLSLLHLIIDKLYGWKIGHVDSALRTLSRQFEVDRESVYDFLMSEVCKKFNCYVVFDTINNTISLYAESEVEKLIGDGSTTTFTVYPPFAQIETVSVGGYKTTQYSYSPSTGRVVLESAPSAGEFVEVVATASEKYETDVFITFDNLAKEVNIDYDADNIKTVLTVTYGDDCNIREVNSGLPYICDLSFYCNPDWMGASLYNAYISYQRKCNNYRTQYINNIQRMVDVDGWINFEENRLSLEYAVASSVNAETVGTYYVRGGSAPNYYYAQVSLPEEYNVNTTYYSPDMTNVQDGEDGNIRALCTGLQSYFYNYFRLLQAQEETEDEEENEDNQGNDVMIENYQSAMQSALDAIAALSSRFAFMSGTCTIASLCDVLQNSETDEAREEFMSKFFDKVWMQLGRTALKELYYPEYKNEQINHLELKYSQKDNENYGNYYVVIIILNSIERAIAAREESIKKYEQEYESLQQTNINISNSLQMVNNFTDQQLVRLSAFLREDELHIEDIIETDQDTIADSLKLKRDAMEMGRIELQKLCQPKLQFSMSMANIYALPEFEPIINQFQLGNMIKVGLRSDYIKQARLLQVDLNFDDFSDFSCEFGELTSLKKPSDIHADLLSQAVAAGKSVAKNEAYWTRGSDQATSTDLKIQQGLLDAIESLKSLDGTQNVSLDKYGLHLEKIDPTTGEKDPEQVWLVNNKIVFTDDNFKTSRMALGRVTVDGNDYYGIISEIMLAGYIEGSKIKGGTIQIGEYVDDNGTTRYAFEVHEDGTVTMGGGGHTIDGYATTDTVQQIQGQVDDINSNKMYRVEITTEAPTVISKQEDKATMYCRVFSWDSDITDDLDVSLFMWKRVSTDEGADAIWNAMPEHQGVKSITIDADDVIENSSFTCEVDLPE